MTAPHWLGLYAGLGGAWVIVWLGSTDAAWSALIRELCTSPVAVAGWWGAFAMWVVMAAAMMLPTALPAFATHDEIADAQSTGGGAALVAGYGAVWLGFAALAASAQVALPMGPAPWIAAALLGGAGAYQFSPLKDACLSRCRRPLTFFMAHWDEGPWRMGLRLGATCLGCCWALMALGLIGGAMSLGFMALATVLMTAEKLSRGTWLSRGIGLACLVGAGFVLAGTGVASWQGGANL
jgi:predicted metal-binding membrane protein